MDLVPNPPTRISSELVSMTTAQLREELARGLTLTAETLYRLGMIWRELEDRGEDLSSLRHGLARTLPLIASGLLAAEAVVAFAGRPAILRAIQGVPLDQQRGLASGQTVEVALATNSQKTELVPITSIPAGRLSAVFQDGAILPPSEQRVRMGRKKKIAIPEEPERRYQPRYDPAAGVIYVGRMPVRLADILEELSSVSGPDYSPVEADEYVIVKTRLKQHEAAKLLASCEKTGLPEWELIRKALRAFGLI